MDIQVSDINICLSSHNPISFCYLSTGTLHVTIELKRGGGGGSGIGCIGVVDIIILRTIMMLTKTVARMMLAMLNMIMVLLDVSHVGCDYGSAVRFAVYSIPRPTVILLLQ